MSLIDQAIDLTFRGTRAGDAEAFAAWVRLVEVPLRRSLRSFAPIVDVEEVVQEALVRMWRLAPTLDLKGANASLAYVLRLAHNLAISEARRLRTARRADLEELEREPEGTVPPDPLPDPRLREAIAKCIKKLPGRPKEALTARIRQGGTKPDRDLAAELNMRINTFVQNVVRARKLLAVCLERAGFPLKEYLS